jgi:phosphatidylserine/phosphatidylglycerophosphate/cardiolipin synthase-like enzyme
MPSLELLFDADHLDRVVVEGMLRASTSLAIATADFKAMLVPTTPGQRRAPSVIAHLVTLARKGVEIRILHAGVPSSAALIELRRIKGGLPPRLAIRRCPRLHAKIIIVDAARMYLGSANLTGAGLGAKGKTRRNFEAGLWTSSSDMIDAASAYFDAIWEGTHCPGCGRRDVCPVPLEEPRL